MHGVFELILKRYETGTIVITSNRNFEDRGNIFGDILMAFAIVGRIVHHANIIKVDGDSFGTKNYANSNYFFYFVGILLVNKSDFFS